MKQDGSNYHWLVQPQTIFIVVCVYVCASFSFTVKHWTQCDMQQLQSHNIGMVKGA